MRCRTPRAIEGITTMAFISRGFHGRPRRDVDPARVPPGQYVVDDFPVLSAGPTPHSPLDEWSFTIHGAVGEPVSWPWKEFAALPAETFTVDIHCVTKWSKLGTTWTGVSLDSLLDSVQTEAEFVSVWCDGGYTTNLPLEDLTGGRAWVAHTFEGEPLAAEHGGPARLLVPHLYLWKSAKWVRGLTLTVDDEPGFWETAGYHNRGDPWREQRYWSD
jgi:DMSO/TMAO reductase YedYZ molybdopterin-dependent catalytic subunit